MKNILLVSRNARHQALIAEAINPHSCRISSVQVSAEQAMQQMPQSSRKPAHDLLLLDLEGDGSDELPMIQSLMEKTPLPVVMFVSRGDGNSAKSASVAGVSAYVVEGLDKDRIEPILAAAVTRFEETRALREELEKTKNSLQQRKVIERAKGLLMERRGCSENEAFSSMRTLAMSRNKRLSDVAQGIIDSIDLVSDIPNR